MRQTPNLPNSVRCLHLNLQVRQWFLLQISEVHYILLDHDAIASHASTCALIEFTGNKGTYCVFRFKKVNAGRESVSSILLVLIL